MAQEPSSMSRDEIVKTISDFYTFLTTYPFLPVTAIRTPPSEGWPKEYHQIWRKMANQLYQSPELEANRWQLCEQEVPLRTCGRGTGTSRSCVLFDRWEALWNLAGTLTQFSILNGPQPQEPAGSIWRLYPTKPHPRVLRSLQRQDVGSIVGVVQDLYQGLSGKPSEVVGGGQRVTGTDSSGFH
ncbi:uncharacterized protein PAC_09404 [Phialocephala subalpina]|uniref:Uncharacterized protein n=1 Tax=Phialocephala subalpina TaxID=576137 RepID=A0A1L7X3B2_9HELO|nr:uncharacterized protein PAC_09404 [Phialocephala subalpina]